VGDLFATARGIYYISYCTQKFQFLRNNAIELSNSLNPQFHMGDTIDISQLKLSLRSFYNLLSGDVSETEEEQINEMLRKAATERTQQSGLTIEERVNENRGSIFVSRHTITSLEASVIGNRIELAHRGGHILFYASLSKKDISEIQNFINITGVPVGIHGTDITFPKPSELLRLLANSDDVEKDQIPFEAMAKNQAYLVDLHHAFKELLEPEKAAVCRGLEMAPWIFSSSFTNIISADISDQKRRALLVGLSLFIVVLFAGFVSLDTLFGESFEMNTDNPSVGRAIIYGSIASGCLYFTIQNFRKFLSYSEKLKRFYLYLKE